MSRFPLIITFLERNVRSPSFHSLGLTFSVKISARDTVTITITVTVTNLQIHISNDGYLWIIDMLPHQQHPDPPLADLDNPFKNCYNFLYKSRSSILTMAWGLSWLKRSTAVTARTSIPWNSSFFMEAD